MVSPLTSSILQNIGNMKPPQAPAAVPGINIAALAQLLMRKPGTPTVAQPDFGSSTNPTGQGYFGQTY